MLRRLPTALTQVKVVNNSESLFIEIKQIIYSLYQSKQIPSNTIKSGVNIKMNTVFINSENSKTSNSHILASKLTNKLDLRIGEKTIALSNLSIYYTWRYIKSLYNNNKFKISTPTWNDKFELPDGSYSVSDIQDYFEYILEKHGQILTNMNHQCKYM